MKKIIVSILHYNSNKDTKACLESLVASQLDGFQIETYVLDNGSKEELDIEEVQFKRINIHVLKNSVNVGFTGGHNQVFNEVKDTDYDFFLLLNNDSLLAPDCLKEMIDATFDIRTAAIVPKIYFTRGREFHKNRYKESEKGKVFWYAGGKMDWENVMSLHRGVDEVDRGQYDSPEEIEFATGACLLLRREAIKKIGLFDRRYFLYYEDADLSMRIRKNGYLLQYVPDAVVWHNNAGSSGSGSPLHDYYLTRNRMLFGMRYAPLRTKLALIRESFRLLTMGRRWQKIGIRDYYLKKFGKGSYYSA